MNYQQKYLKYKTKYLIQKGGYNNISLKLSQGLDIKNKNIIKQNDKIIITECIARSDSVEQFIAIMNNKEEKLFSNYVSVNSDNTVMKMNLIAIIDEITYDTNNLITLKIKYDINGIEYSFTFNSDIFNTINFYKIETLEQNSNNDNNLIKQINQSEKKILDLELQLKNHYHDLPTTGMKLFTESHHT